MDNPTPTPDWQLSTGSEVFRPVLNTQVLAAYFHAKNDTAKLPQMIAFAEKLFSILPQQEQIEFARDPINFVSQQFLFRGLTADKYANVLNTGHFEPQSGQMNSRAVFCSDSPFAAASYGGVVAMIDRKSVSYKGKTSDGFITPGTSQYRQLVENYLSSLPPEHRRDALWDVDNEFDLVTQPSGRMTPQEHVYALRHSQPLSAVTAFFVPEASGYDIVYPPKKSFSVVSRSAA